MVYKIVASILLLLFFFSNSLTAQELGYRKHTENGNYNQFTIFPPNGVADDFGPRRYSPNNFHGGVDYNSEQDDGNADKWDLIHAPASGTIVDVNRLYTTFSYKQFCYEIDSARLLFGHVYDNYSVEYAANDSTVILKRMVPRPTNPNEVKWAQVIILPNDTLAYGQVIGQVELDGDTLVTSVNVREGSPLVPLGESSAENQAHLHLNTIPLTNNFSTGVTIYNSNPLQYVNYPNIEYEIKNYSLTDSNNITINYPGNAPSSIASRVKMVTEISGQNLKRYDHINDVNNVRIKISKLSQEFTIFTGATHASIIDLGGRINEQIINHPRPNFGNWNRTGVDSRAYNSGYPSQPFDIYHFTDFITRIHRDDPMDGGDAMIAYCPMDARYNDGPYELYAEVKNVRDSSFYSDTLAFNLDNWKPFVQQVEFRRGNQLLYRRGWNCKTEEECRGVAISTSLHNQMRHIC